MTKAGRKERHDFPQWVEGFPLHRLVGCAFKTSVIWNSTSVLGPPMPPSKQRILRLIWKCVCDWGEPPSQVPLSGILLFQSQPKVPQINVEFYSDFKSAALLITRPGAIPALYSTTIFLTSLGIVQPNYPQSVFLNCVSSYSFLTLASLQTSFSCSLF